MLRSRLFLDVLTAVFSGVLLALSFPQPDYSFLAWFSLVPLLLIMDRRPFLSGYAAGLAFFAVALYWLNIVMVTYGHLHPFLSLAAYILLALYLALFFALATWVPCWLKKKLGYPFVMTMPVVWVALELLRGVLLTGFPWVLLGYSQHDNDIVIQSADLFGVYAASGLLIMANCAIASFVIWLKDRGRRFREGRYAAVLVLLLIINAFYGHKRLGTEFSADEKLSVAVVQGNIDQTMKWAPENQFHTIEVYERLSRNAAEMGAELIIWPESATPFYFQDATVLQQAVLETPRTTASYLLTGSPAYKKEPDREFSYFNSAFLVSPEGGLVGRSDKVHLVPFGEYVPLSQFLPFIEKLVYGIGDFSPGNITPLRIGEKSIGVLVCYEAIFPELARGYVEAGSSLLVNITNDAWFGRSSAPYQHLAMAKFRAIENRRWLARSANTGISALVDPFGQVVKQSGLFEESALVGRVDLLTERTFYSRFGDIIPLFFLLVSIVWLCQGRLRK